MLFLLVTSVLALAFETRTVRADETVYINADGSITPATAPITTIDNVTYAFTGNVNESIVVERSNIVVDGAGFTVQGSGSGNGIDLDFVYNVTVENTSITGFSNGIWFNASSNSTLANNSVNGNGDYGIYLDASSNDTLIDNEVAENYEGIILDSSSNNTLSDNDVTENPAYGIALNSSSYNTLVGNTVLGNAGLGGSGIYLSSSSYNILSSNNATENYYNIVLDSSSGNVLVQNVFNKSFSGNFVIYGSVLTDYINWVDDSNSVNGKPIYYIVNQNSLLIDPSTYPSIGYLALVNCTNIMVENITLTNDNEQGALFAYTSNSTITKSNILNGDYGIYLDSCSNDTVSDNNVTGTGDGIYVLSSSNNTLNHNNVTGNNGGISLNSDSNNMVSSNNVTGNKGGIGLSSSSNDTVSCNIVSGSASWGMWLLGSSSNMVSGNIVTQDSFQGIYLSSCFDDAVSGNNVTGNYGDGIYVDLYCFNETVVSNSVIGNSGNGIILYTTWNNTVVVNATVQVLSTGGNAADVTGGNSLANCTVSGNEVTGNAENGIALIRTSGNTVSGNSAFGNGRGIFLDNSSNNTIYHNNFINNTEQAVVSGSEPNTWDDGYPSGGNYWSDYTGSDSHGSPYQNTTGSDGIGDTPYVIDANNTDHYPLMAPITSFDVGTWNGTSCNVDIVSNSTVSNLQVDITNRTLSFNITGPTSTYGFCRVTIPNVIVQDLWHGNFAILIDNEQWPFTNWTDTSNTYVYINYTHSEHEVKIIPEFPSTVTVCLLTTLSIAAIVFANRRTPRKLKSKPVVRVLQVGIKTPPLVNSHLPYASPYYP
jgi:parallel beta-helix repeat protein